MTDKLKQIAEEEVIKLPKEVQEAIGSLDWASVVEEIGRKYLLNESEINDLQVETLLVLVGMEGNEFFDINVESNVGTSKNEATKIASEVTEKIFTPIYNKLTQNIKNNPAYQSPSPDQTLSFILSGGDYSTLIENRSNREPEKDRSMQPLPKPPTLQDIKDKLLVDEPGNRLELSAGDEK